MKKIIIITGHPGSGKTSIAKNLADTHKVMVVTKDALKERMFDALGANDKNWSLKVSAAAHRIMDDIVKEQLRIGQSIIVESNFKPDIDSRRFTKLAEEYDTECLQILCQAESSMLFDRWVARIEKGERHGGHVEEISLDEIKENFTKPYEPLALPGVLVAIDTTDFSQVDERLATLELGV